MTPFTLSFLVTLTSQLRRAGDRRVLLRTLDEGIARTLEPRVTSIYVRDEGEAMVAARGSPCVPTPGILSSLRRVSALHVGSSRMGWPTTRYAEADLEFLRTTQAKLLVPARDADGHLEAVLVLGPKRNGALYGQEEVDLAVTVAGQFGAALENLRLADEVRSRRDAENDLRREIETAREVQERFLPERPPQFDGVAMAGVCLPARICGGDYFDFLRIDAGRLGLAVADVSDKGLAAAMLMSKVQATLRASIDAGAGVQESAAMLNRVLCEVGLDNRFVTMFFGILERPRTLLRYLNAGHNPPLLLRSGADSVERLLPNAPVLGVMDGWRGRERTVEVHPGDVLVAYTDGLSEASAPGGEEFGEERIASVLRARRADGPGADHLLRAILDEVRDFSGGAAYTDDLTVTVLRLA